MGNREEGGGLEWEIEWIGGRGIGRGGPGVRGVGDEYAVKSSGNASSIS